MLFYYETNVTGFNKKEKSLIEKNKKKKESQTTLLDPSTSSRNNSKWPLEWSLSAVVVMTVISLTLGHSESLLSCCLR